MDLSHHPLDALSLSWQGRDFIECGHIDTLEQLCSMSESQILKYRGVGRATVAIIVSELAKRGLSLHKSQSWESK